MNNEIMRQKYVNLYNELRNIRLMLDSANEIYNDLMVNIKQCLSIDDGILMEDMLISTSFNNDNLIYEIDNVIIPDIKNKMEVKL